MTRREVFWGEMYINRALKSIHSIFIYFADLLNNTIGIQYTVKTIKSQTNKLV